MTFTNEQQVIIKAAMETGDIPGLSVALVNDGEMIASGGFGFRNREQQHPMTGDTISSIASLTKSFTAVGIMMLVEEGKLALDEPVQSYLPDFRVADAAASRIITPRMLLAHKSGMGRTGHQTPVFTQPVAPYRDRADLVSRLGEVTLQTAPNVAWSYCNEGYVTLGLLIETLAGIPLEQYFTERIFQPLGLEQTHAGFGPWKKAENGTTGYRWTPDGLATAWLPDEYSIYLSTGGIVSTSPDLARYQIASMDYRGNPLLSAGSLEQMQTISMPFGDSGWGYGLGWWVRWHAGRKVVAHSGGQAGVATYSLMLPAQRSGVVVIANLGGAKVANLAEQLAGTLLGEPLYRESIEDPLPIRTNWRQPDASERSGLCGRFSFGQNSLTIGESGGLLTGLSLSPEERPEPASKLMAIGPDLFMSVSDASLVQFVPGDGGNQDRLLTGGNMYSRES